MGREAGPGSRGCVQADGGDSVVRIDGRVLRALARARRSRLFPIDRRVLSCAPRARAHVQEPIVSLRLRVLDSLGAGGGDDGDDKDGALIKTVDGGYNSGRRGPPRCFSSALCRLCSPAGCANAALCTAARAPARGGARHAQPHTHAHCRAPCSLRTQANPRTNSSARARAPHAQLLLPQDGVRRAVPRHGRGPPERLRRGPPGRGGPLAHAADPGARPRTPRRACRRPAFPPAGGVRPTARLASLASPCFLGCLVSLAERTARLASLACACESMSVCVWTSTCFAQCICASPRTSPGRRTASTRHWLWCQDGLVSIPSFSLICPGPTSLSPSQSHYLPDTPRPLSLIPFNHLEPLTRSNLP